MKIIKSDIDNIISEYLAGYTIKNLAGKYGVNHKTIRSKIPSSMIRPGGRDIPVINMAAAIKLFDSGIGLGGIAKILGCSPTFMTRLFARNGVKTRNASEQQFARVARMTPEERQALAKPSHDAIRGTKRSVACLEKRALARCKIVSGYELELIDMLASRSVVTNPQFPIGPYNCDFAAGPVAVEIFGGHWHWTGHHLASVEERFRYILNAGWHLLIIPVTKSSPLTPAVADYVASYVKDARRNPSARREYRVVWRAGEYFTAGSLEDDKISIEPPFTGRRNFTSGRYETIPR